MHMRTLVALVQQRQAKACNCASDCVSFVHRLCMGCASGKSLEMTGLEGAATARKIIQKPVIAVVEPRIADPYIPLEPLPALGKCTSFNL